MSHNTYVILRSSCRVFLLLLILGTSSCVERPSNSSASADKDVLSGQDEACHVYPKFYIEDDAIRARYFETILRPVELGEIVAYTDEAFTEKWDMKAHLKQENRIDSFYRPDPETNEPGWEVIQNSFSWEDVVAYKFKACISENNDLKVKAIGPMVSLYSEGAPMGEFVLFWVDLED